MQQAPDRPRWTESPRGGGRAGLLGNVRFRGVFWEAPVGRRWSKRRSAVSVEVPSAVMPGVKMGGARLDGDNPGCDWAVRDELARADVASERQRGGQRDGQ